MNRYIKTVILENFQSYKNETIHLKPGLNLLSGTSDSGKSAILRAISFVLYNYPKKDSLIHYGESETRVTVVFSDGVKVTRIKGEDRNAILAYDAKGKEFKKEKIDTAIPDDIKELLGNPPEDEFNGLISYSDQFSKMFLVDLSPTDLPRSLSNLTGIEVLEESAKQLMTNYRALEKQNRLDEKEYKNLLEEAQSYSFVNKYDKDLSDLSLKFEKILEIESKIVALKEINIDIDFLINDSYLQVYDKILTQIETQIELIKQGREMSEKHHKLKLFDLFSESHVTEETKNKISSIADKINYNFNTIQILSEKIKTTSKVKSLLSEYIEVKEKGEALTNVFKELSSEVEKQETSLNEYRKYLIDENIQCSACGSFIK